MTRDDGASAVTGDTAAPPTPGHDPGRLRAAFEHWSRVEAPSLESPIYARLGLLVAGDGELLALAAEGAPGQPPPNLLFGAVHYLLDGERDHPLAAYYATLGGERPLDGGIDAAFRAFCAQHRVAITGLLRTRAVQTNEVGRSLCLMPASALVAAEAGAPLAVIEIGPSAGLNLNFDRYRYDYGQGVTAGDPASPVVLATESRGEVPPPRGGPLPRVVTRVGIDLRPLDATNADDRRWLRALVWPEHRDRLALLTAALDVARAHPPRLVAGDAVAVLPAEVAAAPAGAQVVLFATYVLNQLAPAQRTRLRALLRDLSHARPLALIAMSSARGLWEDTIESRAALWLLRARAGEASVQRLATCSAHGRWIDWAPQAATPD